MDSGAVTVLALGGTAFGLLCYAMAAGKPSRHSFVPNPERPRECLHCGRREEAHHADVA